MHVKVVCETVSQSNIMKFCRKNDSLSTIKQEQQRMFNRDDILDKALTAQKCVQHENSANRRFKSLKDTDNLEVFNPLGTFYKTKYECNILGDSFHAIKIKIHAQTNSACS